MSASKGSYLRAAIYNAINRATNFTAPTTLYLSAHTAAPGLTGANEVSGNGYARVAITIGAPTAGAGSNSATATFTGPTPSNWGTLTHFGVWDSLTVGNYLWGDQLTNPIATSVGVPVTFPAGNITYAET